MAGLLLAAGPSAAVLASSPFQVGQMVERVIDDRWYQARITVVDAEIEELDLVYLDDGNKEQGVSFDEVRLCVDSETEDASASEGSNGGSAALAAAAAAAAAAAKTTLRKPLAGLVEDDWQERQSHVPTAVVHACHDTEEAIILNGAENEQAAGGGLRALRFIRSKQTN